MQGLTASQANELFDRLEELEEKIDEIKADVELMMEIHELVHPEAVEEAREKIESDRRK